MAEVITLSISKAEQFVVALSSVPFDVDFNATIDNETDLLGSITAVDESLVRELERHSKIYLAIEELRLAITSVGWLRKAEIERIMRVNALATVNSIYKQVADKPAIKDMKELRKLQESLQDGEQHTFFALMDTVVHGLGTTVQKELEDLAALKADIQAKKDTLKVSIPAYVVDILVENKIVDNPAECG